MSLTSLAVQRQPYKSPRSDRAGYRQNLTVGEVCSCDTAYLAWLLRQDLSSSLAELIRAELGMRELTRAGSLEKKVAIEIDSRHAALMRQLIEAGFGSLQRRTSPADKGKLGELCHSLAVQLSRIGGTR